MLFAGSHPLNALAFWRSGPRVFSFGQAPPPPLKNLFTSFFQTMSIPAPPPQTTSSLVFWDFLMGLEPLKRHALRLNRFKQPLDAGYAAGPASAERFCMSVLH